ncbi:hypothetical protein ATY78_15230 [Rhizobium sp. R635]|uniref:hypothetical protein n=1 Tax=unclassified Rhizobium TaxID=2613769 RepID=UPI000B5309DD|nr:hypothetical protein [Rhizobium sp. R635]OWV91413.1 hypothetical protein ATY78_15230 [Rhizobium sp. R635]
MNKDSHAGKGHGLPSEVPPERPDMLEEALKPIRHETRREAREWIDGGKDREGRNWAILLTLFSFLLVQLAGIALIIWAIFW